MKHKKTNHNRKYKRKKKPNIALRRLISCLSLLALIFLGGYSLTAHLFTAVKAETQDKPEMTVTREFKTDSVTFVGRYQSTFADIQLVQEVAAQLIGIEPLASADDIPALVENGTLVEVPECSLYETQETSHPYLIPEAKMLLDVIAQRYQQRINEQKQLRLTGCLRTHEFVKKLMRRNRNSVKNSCHLYGTTFDISYRDLVPQEKKVLAQVLYELQQAGHCYVKYEYKQPCFHITLRPEDKTREQALIQERIAQQEAETAASNQKSK